MNSRRTHVRELSLQPRRALSIRQPWTWAILYAGKRVENRSWYTSFRGPIFIHAGLTVERVALETLRDDILAVPLPRPPAVCGALLATATIIDCVPASSVSDEQECWAVGPWCIVLSDVLPLAAPIPHLGKLGLFLVDLTK
jgi:hypothetical protein